MISDLFQISITGVGVVIAGVAVLVTSGGFGGLGELPRRDTGSSRPEYPSVPADGCTQPADHGRQRLAGDPYHRQQDETGARRFLRDGPPLHLVGERFGGGRERFVSYFATRSARPWIGS